MKMKTLTALILATIPASSVFAAALDRSGQSIAPFLQNGNYAEVGGSLLIPDVSGQETDATIGKGRAIPDMGDSFAFAQAGIKVQPVKNFSFGLLYDQPFGAKARYSGENIFVTSPTDTVLAPSALAGIRAQTISKEINTRLPAALTANLANGINQTVSSQAAQAIANGLVPPGTPQALVEASIRNNSQQMAAIEAGVTTAITNQVTAGVTTAVDQGLAAVNSTVGGTGGATVVDVESHSLSLLFGFQPNENWNFYGGPVYQTIEGNLKLRGQAYSLYNGYDAEIPEDDSWGWLAGFAYQIPEIALKASITYRSEIDYDLDINESIPTLSALSLIGGDPAAIANAKGTTPVTTPQSVNLDLQSGIMADTVAFANIRWVDWSNFAIRPYKFGLVSDAVGPLVSRPNGFNLVEYSDDQWSVNTGIGRKLTDTIGGSFSVGWDSGSGNPITTLGPTEGYWNVGLGLRYSPTPKVDLSGGIKYFWLGDAQAQTGAQAGDNTYLAEFNGNDALAFGLKLGYHF